MGILEGIPENTWWDLDAFISAVHEHQPDYQRPGGDYDSWFIRRASDQAYLRGFSSWHEVDGALLRFIITGPLHWLGLYDLASPASRKGVTSFRTSAWTGALLQGRPPQGLPPDAGKLKVSADGLLRLPARIPLWLRYQVARFCEWESGRGNEYLYRVTAGSLQRAASAGLKTAHLATLLRRHASTFPPNMLLALERWDRHAAQAHVEHLALLRVESPGILEALQQSDAAQHLGEVFNPTTVVIRAGHERAVRDALAELGYFAEIC